ncbi:MAG TPA: hypothetical protein VKD90_17970 [Gemmataceae bacterium]|nr:hypothetical protein [Gemmataceae bacterium]
MPIKTYCPDCDAPVSAPNSAAGDRVDCPECGASVKVPRKKAADAEDPRDRPRAGHPERARRDDDEDDRSRSRSYRRRDDLDDRPRKDAKRKRNKKGQLSPALVIGLAGGGLLALLLLGGVGWYLFLRAAPDKTINGEDWYKASGGDGLFTAYFPGSAPKYEKAGFEPPAILFKKGGLSRDDISWKMESWIRKEGGREYSVLLFTMPNHGGNADGLAQVAAVSRVRPGPGVVGLVDEAVTVNGHAGRRVATRGQGEVKVAQSFAIGTRQMILIVVTGPESLDPGDPKVVAFFENFTINMPK